MNNEVMNVPRYFILFLRKIKQYVPQGGEKVRLPQGDEIVDTSILYMAMGALMLVISMSIFLYGAVEDYRAARVIQAKPVVHEEGNRQQNIPSINTITSVMVEQKTEPPVNPLPSLTGAVETTTGELPRKNIVNVETSVVKSQEETPISPIRGKIIVSYGWREHPFYKDWRFHSGINIQGQKGDQIRAALSGKVISIHKDTAGIMVETAHEDGLKLMYGNIGETYIREGQSINQGQILGGVGENLIEPGTYLHFEVWKHDRSVDPQTWMGDK
jgi:murein DD-endopeptidase MepM/ murein hydrolase activator NlpD